MKHIDGYFASRFDKPANNWSKQFKFSMKKIPPKNRAEFRRAIRADFAIAKADIIIKTPVDKGDLVNNMKVSFKYDESNFIITVGDIRKYTHYQNSGTPQFTGNTGFITDALVDFNFAFSELIKEYKK